MSAFDFNTATEQRDFDLIPDKTNAVVQMHIQEGNVGEGGLLTLSENGKAEMLRCEFTVVGDKYAKRKFFTNMVLSGTTDGHAQAADISKSQLRAILESARGIKPKDVSEAARKARVAELRDFEGIRFWARIGIEPQRGEYRARNTLHSVITPDQKGWSAVQQVEQPLMHAVPADGKTIVKPAWAQAQ
jgi:hypothetical protein